MLSQIPYYQNLLCKKREREFFNFHYPLMYQNNIIQPKFGKKQISYQLENKNPEFHCKDGCNISFKSLQKKIAHHNRLDEHCTKENGTIVDTARFLEYDEDFISIYDNSNNNYIYYEEKYYFI